MTATPGLPKGAPDLFVGIPTWNSERFLAPCLRQIARVTRDISVQITVWDNDSTDATQDIARKHGCDVIVKNCGLPDALNEPLDRSSAGYSLLMHADTILLSDKWFELTVARLRGNVALVSPQDIGCGPFTRPRGKGMPESCFMLFDTRKIRQARTTRWVRRFRLPYPRRVVDFYVQNVTHKLPDALARAGLGWAMMKVHTSRPVAEPIYTPAFKPLCWSRELSYLEYGLGNFYSLYGTITHYHNWFERLVEDVDPESQAARRDQGGIPLAYIKAYTDAFLRDLENQSVNFPDPALPEREPKAIPISSGDGGS